MEDLEATFTGFSCPFEQFAEDLAPTIAGEYARGISHAFLDRHRDVIEGTTRGLFETLQPWLTGGDIAGSGWDLCFGDAYRANFQPPSSQHTRIAAGMATHVGGRGLSGAWRADLSTPTRLRWGTLLLPACTAIEVETDGQRATITTDGERRTFERFDVDWAGECERVLMVTQHGMRLSVLDRSALVLRDFDGLVEKALDWIDPRMIAVFNAAVDIVAEFTPMYLPWIRRALHHVFVLDPLPNTIESGSVEHYLGLIHVSAHPKPLPIAELLVHEAAHQHMNLLTKLGPMDDGSDTRTYYSPPVDKHRPLSLIMAAYHAFANVLLFYRLCRARGIADRAECDRQESILAPWLVTLEPALRDNPALTDIGRALWEPLRNQLQTIS